MGAMTFNQGVEIMVHFIQALSALFLVYGGVLAFAAAFRLGALSEAKATRASGAAATCAR